MKKTISIFLVSFCLLLMAGAAIPYFFKDELIAKTKSEISKQVNAKVDFTDIDVSLLNNIRNFPNIALGLEGITITGITPFEGDTLLHIGQLNLSLDLMSIINGDEYKIEQVTLKKGVLNAIVNKDGAANWDILKPTEENDTASGKPFKLGLNKLTLDDISLFYDDLNSGTSAKIEHLSHSGKGDFTAAILDYSSNTTIEKVSVAQGLIGYLKNAEVSFDSKINIDQTNNKYTFENNKLTLNNLGLLFNGSIAIPDTLKTVLDVSFKADKTDFKSLLSLIPAIYSKDFEKIKTSGNLQLEGDVKGILEGENYPSFSLNVNVDNGKFQYPDLPAAVSNIFIQTQVTHPQGILDKTNINIPVFRMQVANDPISGRLNISTPISDPHINLAAKGKINLADVQRFYPLEGVKKLTGTANVDIAVDAKKSAVDNKSYQEIQASGNIAASGIEYVSEDIGKPVSVSGLELHFNPQYVDMPVCNAVIGNSDFDIKGKLENLIGYVLSKDAIISGNVSINSRKIDANEFLPDSSVAQKSTAQQAKEVVRIPKNIDLTGTAVVGELLYDQLNINQLNGKISLRDEQLNLHNLNASLLGGDASVSGYYNTKTDIPTGNLSYNIHNFDVQKVYEYVGAMQQAAPIMKFITGSFGSDMNMQMAILPDLSPNLNTLNGTAGFKMPLANIKGVPALQKIIEQTKLKQLENLRIENLDIKATVANGRVLVAPFETKVNNMKMVVSGSQGIADQSMDYAVAIDVPWKELGQASSFAQGLLAKNPIPQLNGMVPEIIRINMKVGGTFNKPTVQVGKPDASAGNATLKDAVKEQAQQQAQQLKEEVKTQAKATLDTVKSQVKEQVSNKLQEILQGKPAASDTTPKKSVQENVKDQLKNKFGWPK